MPFFTTALMLTVLPAAADAATAPAPPTVSARSTATPLPLTGIVTDQTLSGAGHEFYKQFCAFWHDKPQSEMYAIAIRERLSARRGNQVVVEYAGRVVFHGALPPARAAIGTLGQQAVDVAYETVVNAEVQRLLFSPDELGPDEF